MSRRRLLVSVVGATLLFGPALRAQFAHPDLKTLKKPIGTLLVLPPQAVVAKAGVTGQEPLIQESQQVEAALHEIVTELLRRRGCKTAMNPFIPGALEANPEYKYALADLQERFNRIAAQLADKPKDVRKARFTLGDDVAKLPTGEGTVDTLVFIRGSGRIVSGGMKAVAAVTGFGQGISEIRIRIAFVDARSGLVLFYAKALGEGDFVKKPEKMRDPIRVALKFFLGMRSPCATTARQAN